VVISRFPKSQKKRSDSQLLQTDNRTSVALDSGAEQLRPLRRVDNDYENSLHPYRSATQLGSRRGKVCLTA
jgi:hypothetical protein